MANGNRGDLLLGDEDRLPWLEPAQPISRRDPRAAVRWVVFAVIVLLLLAAIVAAGLWLTRTGATDGGGALIEAPEGPYKVRPADPGGMRVEGTGDVSYGASDGRPPDGAIDLSAQPETPVAAATTPAAPERAPPPDAGRSARTAIPASGGRIVPSTSVAGAASTRPTGSLVQLGSFNSESRAREAWRILSDRFTFLDGREPLVATGEVNGRTVYRLRLDTGGGAAARELCQRLTLGGEACLVVGR